MQRELENAQNKLYDEYQLTRREAEELGIVIEDPQKAQRDLNDIKNKIRALGNVNVGAIEEYKEVSERYEFMKTQIDDVESSRAELLTLIGDLTGKMSERFREQFDRINTIFGQTFSELFGGCSPSSRSLPRRSASSTRSRRRSTMSTSRATHSMLAA